MTCQKPALICRSGFLFDGGQTACYPCCPWPCVLSGSYRLISLPSGSWMKRERIPQLVLLVGLVINCTPSRRSLLLHASTLSPSMRNSITQRLPLTSLG